MDKEALYQERLQRIEKAINLEPVDRIPIIYLGPAFSPRYMGMSLAQFCSDPEAAFNVTLAAMERLGDVDGISSLVPVKFHIMLSSLWLSRVAVPGRDLPPDSLWQIREAEVMTVEDYDYIIEHGWQAFLGYYLPRIVDMAEFQEAMAWGMANVRRMVETLRQHGFVVVAGGATTIPFEYFSGGRSMERFFIDLYRIPDKVKAAMDVIMPDLIQAGIMLSRGSGVPRVWVGGWRAASALVGRKIWDTFVFPYYLQMVNALAENGIISILHFDQNWTRDLERFREFPAKKCVLNLDGMTDIRKAKELLGDHMAIMGDVPASLFAAGTPDDIYNYVRDLVRDIGPTGFLLSSGCDIPVNAKPENVEAFVAAGREYGVVH